VQTDEAGGDRRKDAARQEEGALRRRQVSGEVRGPVTQSRSRPVSNCTGAAVACTVSASYSVRACSAFRTSAACRVCGLRNTTLQLPGS
jgi:hypothetical protein